MQIYISDKPKTLNRCNKSAVFFKKPMQHPLRQGSQTNKKIKKPASINLQYKQKYKNISVKQKPNKIKINQNKTRAEKHEIKSTP